MPAPQNAPSGSAQGFLVWSMSKVMVVSVRQLSNAYLPSCAPGARTLLSSISCLTPTRPGEQTLRKHFSAALEKRGLAQRASCVCDERACWVSTLHESEEVRQGSSKFTDAEKLHVGLVDFIWNVHKGEAMECLFCHPPPEECTDEAVNLLVGNCKPRQAISQAGHCRSAMM